MTTLRILSAILFRVTSKRKIIDYVSAHVYTMFIRDNDDERNDMQTNLQKWGNSLGVRIPSFITSQLSLHPGDSVDIIAENQQISIRPRKNSLTMMLAQITEENIHDLEWDDSDVKGREVW